jgi:hypothetical protein
MESRRIVSIPGQIKNEGIREGHTQYHVAKKEHAAGKTENRWIESEILIHLQCSKTDVNAIKIVDEHHHKY